MNGNRLTVGELRKILKEFPADARIVFDQGEDFCPVVVEATKVEEDGQPTLCLVSGTWNVEIVYPELDSQKEWES